MKNKCFSEGSSQKVEHSRAKLKSPAVTVGPAECVFCREEERDLAKMSKKTKTISEITHSRGIPHKFSESECAACRIFN